MKNNKCPVCSGELRPSGEGFQCLYCKAQFDPPKGKLYKNELEGLVKKPLFPEKGKASTTPYVSGRFEGLPDKKPPEGSVKASAPCPVCGSNLRTYVKDGKFFCLTCNFREA